MTILEYREKTPEEKKKYTLIHTGYTQMWFRTILMIVGLGCILTNLLAAHTAIIKPYSWTMNQNLLYFGLQRNTYCIGIFCIFFFFILGGLPIGKALLCRPLFLVSGKVTFEACLVGPFVI
jgi:hypothetical protein